MLDIKIKFFKKALGMRFELNITLVGMIKIRIWTGRNRYGERHNDIRLG